MNNLIISKFKAAAVHFFFTLLVAAITASLVFWVWYPNGLSTLIGGTELYFLILGVEVCLGPLMSLVIYNPLKPRAELIRDYTVVSLIQMAALVYGLHATFITRPVYEVLVIDRIELVRAIDLDQEDIAKAPEPYNALSWFGPSAICVTQPTDNKKRNDILFSALDGKDIHLMPEYYSACRAGAVQAASRPAKALIDKINSSTKGSLISELPEAEFTWLPATSALKTGTVIFVENKAPYYIDFDPF